MYIRTSREKVKNAELNGIAQASSMEIQERLSLFARMQREDIALHREYQPDIVWHREAMGLNPHMRGRERESGG